MEQIVFDNEVVQKSSLYSKCASTLLYLSQRDYSDKYKFSPKIECLDLDTYERLINRNILSNTMDAAIGVSNCSNEKRKTKARLLLVELRMGYHNVNNLSTKELVSKVRHSKELLGNEIPIDQNCIFIFDDKIYEQARRWFSVKGNEISDVKYHLAHSAKTFRTYITNYEDLPYIPKTNAESIKKDVESSFILGDYQGVLKKIDYWLNEARKHKYANANEFEHIIAIIDEIWSIYSQKILKSDNINLEIDAMIFEEDFNNIKS